MERRSMSSLYRRPSLASGAWYTPSESGLDGWISLNTNQAPLPPPSAVAAAVAQAATELHRYPDPQGEPLRSAHRAPQRVARAGAGRKRRGRRARAPRLPRSLQL